MSIEFDQRDVYLMDEWGHKDHIYENNNEYDCEDNDDDDDAFNMDDENIVKVGNCIFSSKYPLPDWLTANKTVNEE